MLVDVFVTRFIKACFRAVGLEIRRISSAAPAPIRGIPDDHLYCPMYSPWLGEPVFMRYYQIASPKTIVSADKCYILYSLARQALRNEGDFWECGVYRGGTAAMLASLLRDAKSTRRLYLFDTFEGMPAADAVLDRHQAGDFADTRIEAVMEYVGAGAPCVYRKGLIPDTFAGLEASQIALAHVDVDLYSSVRDCVQFIWPRLLRGGFILFDDYGAPTCPGARKAVDEFFLNQTAVPICLPTGQVIVFKGSP